VRRSALDRLLALQRLTRSAKARLDCADRQLEPSRDHPAMHAFDLMQEPDLSRSFIEAPQPSTQAFDEPAQVDLLIEAGLAARRWWHGIVGHLCAAGVCSKAMGRLSQSDADYEGAFGARLDAIQLGEDDDEDTLYDVVDVVFENAAPMAELPHQRDVPMKESGMEGAMSLVVQG
jgi:hypothetical protein